MAARAIDPDPNLLVHVFKFCDIYSPRLFTLGAFKNSIVTGCYKYLLCHFLYLFEGSGYFFHDKLIAPLFPTGRGLLPPRKAKYGVGSCWSVRFKYLAAKYRAVAAVRLGRQQAGILP
jgi:hypothetical protein